jgi:uncharacterized integral membrane protein (TIGR00698 family)
MHGRADIHPTILVATPRPRLVAPLLPGLALTAAIAALAFGIHALPGFAALSPLILAIVIGIVLHNAFGTPALAVPGIKFSLRRVLRLAIVLLGLQLTAAQVATVGGTGVAIVAASLVATFLFTKAAGRLLGVEPRLAELIAAGTSICGASAVIATNTVTRGSDEDVAYAVACVTVFGSLSMLIYPLLPGLLHLDPHAYGLWSGSSIHEIAQVVAAAFQGGQAAGELGTVAKLTRVMMLAPMILALGLAARGRSAGKGEGRVPTPWFVLGFIAMVVVNSLVPIPPAVNSDIALVTTFLLSMALAAMGLETSIGKLRARGLRPLALGAAAWLFIALFSLGLIKFAL